MIYSMNELRRCSEAGYPFCLLSEHLHEIWEREKPPPLTETPQTRKIEGAEFKSDVTEEQKPFYTREQIIAKSTPPYVKNLGNNIDLVCSTTAGKEVGIIENKGRTIDIMIR